MPDQKPQEKKTPLSVELQFIRNANRLKEMTAYAENLRTTLPQPFNRQVNMYILAMGKRLSQAERLRLEKLKNGRAFTGSVTPE